MYQITGFCHNAVNIHRLRVLRLTGDMTGFGDVEFIPVLNPKTDHVGFVIGKARLGHIFFK